MREIKDRFREQGLEPGEIIADGKIHRFKADSKDARNSGWYVCYQNHTRSSGELFHVCVFGNYKTGITFTAQTGSELKLSAEDRKAIKDQIEKAKALEEKQREKLHEDTSKEVAKFWETLTESTDHSYLIKKKIDKENFGVRTDGKGSLFIPLRDVDGRLWSLQEIDWQGRKLLYPGGRKRGCCFTFGDVGSASTIYLCEGFATGASIFLATGRPVVVAFDSGNLLAVGKNLKKLYSDKSIIVCGDEDLWTTRKVNGVDEPWNPGREKAEECAKAVLGTAVFPVFESLEERPTDFNDLFVLEGRDRVTDQLLDHGKHEKSPMALYALGFSDGAYFFTSTENRQIVAIQTFSEDQLLKLMPIEYWEVVFPTKSDRGRVDWTTAKSELMQQCRAKGIFDGGLIRGAGVWMDDGRIVVNMGDHLVVDGVRCDLGSIKSRFFYTLGKRLEKLRENPLTREECRTLISACDGFKWSKSREAGTLLAGILVLSRVCGALPVRPHCWVTGGAQTGKTTLLENLIHKIMGHNKLYFLGSTTEAGVRQNLKSDAVPILFDEFETNGPESAAKIASCIELMRASWAASGGVIAKGGSNGVAVQYQVKFSAIVSSIRTKLTNDADKGRFIVLELAPHGSDQDHWKRLSGHLALIDDEFSERLFARTIRLLPVLLKNYKTLKIALAKRADSRFGDQYGMILAGYSILVYDEPITAEEAEWFASQVDLAEEKEVASQADHDDALQHLLTTKLTFDNPAGPRDMLIGTIISNLINPGRRPMKMDPTTGQVEFDFERNALLNIGIKVDSDFVTIVSSNHAEFENRVWRNTKWSQTWGNSLNRIKGATRKKLRFEGSPRWTIQLPIDIFNT